MTPKFSVGEVVILQSESFPELNGECTILSIYGIKTTAVYLSCGNTKPTGLQHSYGLSIRHQRGDGWAESALRKKHQPGEHSFTDLMASLKNPVSV